eukprot:TRINITY_DN6502_c1_g3_i5.p2 TRINITY_DN6502_c1_g3~~TRINITY_DN6502_c1_g3_i5.p2  ORF type:complete len:211 (-),score=-22.48 TRINITY_DN6502_c1_g3_i5:458-1090(-)
MLKCKMYKEIPQVNPMQTHLSRDIHISQKSQNQKSKKKYKINYLNQNQKSEIQCHIYGNKQTNKEQTNRKVRQELSSRKNYKKISQSYNIQYFLMQIYSVRLFFQEPKLQISQNYKIQNKKYNTQIEAAQKLHRFQCYFFQFFDYKYVFCIFSKLNIGMGSIHLSKSNNTSPKFQNTEQTIKNTAHKMYHSNRNQNYVHLLQYYYLQVFD